MDFIVLTPVSGQLLFKFDNIVTMYVERHVIIEFTMGMNCIPSII